MKKQKRTLKIKVKKIYNTEKQIEKLCDEQLKSSIVIIITGAIIGFTWLSFQPYKTTAKISHEVYQETLKEYSPLEVQKVVSTIQVPEAPKNVVKANVVTNKTITGIILGSRLAKANNNPCNIRYTGKKGSTKGASGFARYETPEKGIEACKWLLTQYVKAGHTVKTMVYKYAPPVENNSDLYVNQMATSLKVSPTTKLSDINMIDLLRFIMRKESGSKLL